jgi:hypothetical protein
MSLWTRRRTLEQIADLVVTEVKNLLEGSFDPDRVGGLSEQAQRLLVLDKISNHGRSAV